VALLVGLLLPRLWAPAREAPRRWLTLVVLALASHPLLDAFTVYGTQLFWPLAYPPVMIASIFIVDPLFSLPLLVGAGVALFARDAARIGWWGRMGIAFAAVYLTWTLLAKWNIEQAMRADLDSRGMSEAKLLVEPAPLQSLVWRILAVRGDGTYYEGYFSYLATAPLVLEPYPSTIALLNPISEATAVKRLKWFTRGFFSVRSEDGKVVLTDLRMGGEPSYMFRYVVGEERDGQIVAREPAELLPWPRPGREQLALVWRRIFDPQAK
jgi:inner membrane protein